MNTNFLKYSELLFTSPVHLKRIRTAIEDIISMHGKVNTYGISCIPREMNNIIEIHEEHRVYKNLLDAVSHEDSSFLISLMAKNYINSMEDDNLIEKYTAYLYYLGVLCIDGEETINTLKRLLMSVIPVAHIDTFTKFIEKAVYVCDD